MSWAVPKPMESITNYNVMMVHGAYGPKASRTVPLVSKVCNTQMARLATRLMMGEKLEDLKLKDKKFKHHGAKEAVFPFDKFPKVDPVLGPEMRSTGEVLIRPTSATRLSKWVSVSRNWASRSTQPKAPPSSTKRLASSAKW
ncbi:MAG: hypothetical protein MJZ05_00010 [Fibrobacter sp.]|nr:hypothetical protein [Fibrobacter sp.]